MNEPKAQLPDRHELEIHHDHRDVSGGWLRPTVFGVTDGLVSNFALIAGVSGAHAAARDVALAGLAGLFGGAFSMATGEYISVKSQNEAADAELQVEAHELEHNAEAELWELTEMYRARGLDPELAAEVARQLSHDPHQTLMIHAREELGIDPQQLPSPWTAAGSSLGAFTVGALIPLLPYLLGASTLVISAVLAAVALSAAGVITARFTSRHWAFAGARQLVLGALAAAVTYGVGELFHASVG